MILSVFLLGLTPTVLFQEPVIKKLVEVTDDAPEVHTPTLKKGHGLEGRVRVTDTYCWGKVKTLSP